MITRVTSSEFSAGFLERDRPAIITDALGRWRASERWTPAYLADAAAARRVMLSKSRDGRFHYDGAGEGTHARGFDTTETDFGVVAREIAGREGGTHAYVMQQSIPDVLPELMENLVVPEWIPSDHPAINLWFGRSTTSQLHFDYTNNFFAQLHGTKQFVVFDPRDTDRLYPYHHETETSHLSHVDVNALDDARFPEFAQAAALRFEIKPGELLFLPAFWWHHVHAADVSVSVSFWWVPQMRQVLQAPNAVRALPNFYSIDRLEEFKTTFLDSAQLDFLHAAELFLGLGRTWTACVLTLAAFDEWSRGEAVLRGAQRPQGCRLSNLADDLRNVCAVLESSERIAAPHRPALRSVPVLAAQAAASLSDAAIGQEPVAALHRMVAALCAELVAA